jgi:hypothetical protein
MSSTAFEELRARHAADRDAAFPGYVEQLQWSAAHLRTERERRMRILLATAKARSEISYLAASSSPPTPPVSG